MPGGKDSNGRREKLPYRYVLKGKKQKQKIERKKSNKCLSCESVGNKNPGLKR